MIREFFTDWLVQASVGITVLALAAWLWTGMLSRHPRFLHLVWVVVLAKGLVPPVTHWHVIPARPAAVEISKAVPSVPEIHAPVSPVGLPVDSLSEPPKSRPISLEKVSEPDRLAEPEPTARRIVAPFPERPFRWPDAGTLVLALWAAATLTWIVVAAWRRRTFLGWVRHAGPVDEQAAALVADLSRDMGLRRAPNAILVPARLSPCIVGVGSAHLLLPLSLWKTWTPAQAAVVIRHELAHLIWRGRLLAWIEFFAQALYWWHPAVWFAVRRLRECEEKLCDATAVAGDPHRARVLAQSMVETAAFLADPSPRLPANALALVRLAALKNRLLALRQNPVVRPTPRFLPAMGAPAAAFLLAYGIAQEKPASATVPAVQSEKPGSAAPANEPEPAKVPVANDFSRGPAVAPSPTTKSPEADPPIRRAEKVEASTLSPSPEDLYRMANRALEAAEEAKSDRRNGGLAERYAQAALHYEAARWHFTEIAGLWPDWKAKDVLAGLVKADRALISLGKEPTPDSAYLKGYMVMEDAEKAASTGNLASAHLDFEEAARWFAFVAAKWPDWQPQIVSLRRKLVADALAALGGPKASAQPAGSSAVRTPEAMLEDVYLRYFARLNPRSLLDAQRTEVAGYDHDVSLVLLRLQRPDWHPRTLSVLQDRISADSAPKSQGGLALSREPRLIPAGGLPIDIDVRTYQGSVQGPSALISGTDVIFFDRLEAEGDTVKMENVIAFMSSVPHGFRLKAKALTIDRQSRTVEMRGPLKLITGNLLIELKEEKALRCGLDERCRPTSPFSYNSGLSQLLKHPGDARVTE